ncbi:hypothetical protein GJ496_005398 [Pomphorhynchus laevis]|nr:hypothetical protein GJ496_005398 [Pomphorhynchus laevis]
MAPKRKCTSLSQSSLLTLNDIECSLSIADNSTTISGGQTCPTLDSYGDCVIEDECKMLREACKLYKFDDDKLVNDDDEEDESISEDGCSEDELNEICLEGDIDCLEKYHYSLPTLTEEDASTLLMINEIYQETVRKHLDIIETKLNHIRNMKSKLEKHHSRQRTPRAFTFSQKDCYPFFQDVKGLGPDLSDHTIKAQNDCTKFVSSKCTSKSN